MDRSVLVAGLGISGIQAAGLLLSQGRSVILFDQDQTKDPKEICALLGQEVPVVLGELTDSVIDAADLCVISPGIPLEVPFVQRLLDAGIPVISEIEAAYAYEKGTVIGITGTNGKTTTTTLVGNIMKAWKGEDKAFTTGNIGIPYAKEVLRTGKDSVTTIELSSFQLESVRTFRPHVAAILNITPDHLNRHHTMEIYTEVKERVSMNQTAEDFIILNYEDDRLRAFGLTGTDAKVLWFSGAHALPEGYYLKDDALYRKQNGAETLLIRTDETTLVGRCNYENILAAWAMADAMGVPEEIIRKTVTSFRAVAHRIEYTATVRGVRYYNDSKGTNPDAAIQAIRAMTCPTVLIGGGYDKGSEYDEWIEAFDGKVKKLLLMGVTAEKIAECARKHGFTDIEFVDSMEEAVAVASGIAREGEAVLLSPACASWGMFKNYEERGDIFKALVRDL